MEYVTWHDLVDIGMLLKAVATLVYAIYHNKRK